MTDQEIITALNNNQVGVLPTDTLYGLVGSALSKEAVKKVYRLRHRSPDKPFIILIASIEQLKLFNIPLDENTRKYLQKIWPNQVSVILPCPEEKFLYLHRGKQTLAFRMPDKEDLLSILEQTGPLVAPSANPEGEKTAETIEEAKKYFGEDVAFYKDEGKLNGQSSTLISLKNDHVTILRQGAFKL